MDKLGESLFNINELFLNKLSLQSILQIGIQLVTCLEKIHEMGFVFNDLKPDNILIGNEPFLE